MCRATEGDQTVRKVSIVEGKAMWQRPCPGVVTALAVVGGDAVSVIMADGSALMLGLEVCQSCQLKDHDKSQKSHLNYQYNSFKR